MTLAETLTIAIYAASLVVSFVTVRILVVTLKETVELNRVQLDLIKVSINQVAREIRPEFELQITYDNPIRKLSIYCRKNIAVNVRLTINHDASMDSNGELVYHDISIDGDVIMPDKHVWSTLITNEMTANGFFRIQYEDDDGRKYEQRLFFVDTGSSNMRPTLLS